MTAQTSYAAALQRLYAYERSGMKLDLALPRQLHEALDSPETAFRAVQIAGTNGKGTTAACLAAILRAAGIRTGLFTSPHLLDFAERVRIDGRALPHASVERLMERVAPAAETLGASYFETVTALGALAFREADVEWVVAEVGLGGRLDATTVWPAPLGAITAIDFDHMDLLGGTLEHIAAEKAGIARRGSRLLCAEPRPALRAMLERDVTERGSAFLAEGREWRVDGVRAHADGIAFDVTLPGGATLRDVSTPLLGAHQARNAALAAALALALEDARVTERAVRAGLAAVRWPGRAEMRSVPVPGAETSVRVLLDVAHNPSAAARLAETLAVVEPGGGAVGLVGMVRDKDAAGFAAALGPSLSEVIVTAPSTARALPAGDLAAAFASASASAPRVSVVEPDCARAVADALQRAAARGTVCVLTGSCYTVGDCLPAIGVTALEEI